MAYNHIASDKIKCMAEEKNKGGRPRLTEEQKALRKKYLLQKLEPYLMTGLSVNKALREAKLLNSEFYRYMAEDRYFGEKIAKYKQFIGVLINQAIVAELLSIIEKQNGNIVKGIQPQPLSKDDVDFLCWFALNSNLCREEWGRHENLSSFDPEAEIQQIKRTIEQYAIKEVLHS